jgi:hypothetical protein
MSFDDQLDEHAVRKKCFSTELCDWRTNGIPRLFEHPTPEDMHFYGLYHVYAGDSFPVFICFRCITISRFPLRNILMRYPNAVISNYCHTQRFKLYNIVLYRRINVIY